MKCLNANFNSKTGESIVTIGTEIGNFTGKAKLHPEDIPSEYAGCEIAEQRAFIKYLKAKRKYINIKLKTLVALKDDIRLMMLTQDIPTALETKYIIHRIDIALKECHNTLNEIDNSINALKTNITESIAFRDKLLFKKVKDKIK